ncbi:hypothetical protein [Arthrobacter bambusae]|uniref:hypothetical protein n=1 Tax=Arthrobacter bambusae TaxID=1338426 RepID=UPI002784B8CB|nr:hypothetical protein [Arthrobacter bambusae]MDQ0028384.1 hypothetical protein [Arthrobacter bambusae]MDQ0096821.1 hypothetical protein [Arthrobacter bambusae]
MDEQKAAEEAGGYGTPTPEQETGGREAQQSNQQNDDATSTASEGGHHGSASVPSADAELDESNSEGTEPGRPFSSEPKGDATGLPADQSPKDDDGETFDAG